MHIHLQGVVLFLHIAVVVSSFFIAGFLHVAFHAMARLRTGAELRPWASLAHRLGPALPVLALLILVMGAWLVGIEHGTADRTSFSNGWVLTGLVTLVVIEGLAGALLEPRIRRLAATVESGPDGPVSAEVHALTVDPIAWAVGHVATFGFLGVVFDMTAKPSGAYAWLFPVVGAAVGVALARLQLARVPSYDGDGSVTVPAQGSGDRAGARAGA